MDYTCQPQLELEIKWAGLAPIYEYIYIYIYAHIYLSPLKEPFRLSGPF